MPKRCRFIFGVFVSLIILPLSHAHAAVPDFGIASDVLVYVNDGLGSAETLNDRISALRAPPHSSPHLIETYAAFKEELVVLLGTFRAGAEMPWTTPSKLSKAVIEIVDADYSGSMASTTTLLEYMNYQYLSKAYFGVFEYGPPLPTSLGGADEAQILVILKSHFVIDKPDKSASAFLALSHFVERIDYDRAGIQQKDGKTLTPLSFYRSVRALQK